MLEGVSLIAIVDRDLDPPARCPDLLSGGAVEGAGGGDSAGRSSPQHVAVEGTARIPSASERCSGMVPSAFARRMCGIGVGMPGSRRNASSLSTTYSCARMEFCERGCGSHSGVQPIPMRTVNRLELPVYHSRYQVYMLV